MTLRYLRGISVTLLSGRGGRAIHFKVSKLEQADLTGARGGDTRKSDRTEGVLILLL